MHRSALRTGLRTLGLAALTAALTLPLAGMRAEAAPPDPSGVWLTDDGEAAVEVDECGGGTICGRIIWLKSPLMDGQPVRDGNNPSPAARNKPVCGLTIFGGLKPKGNRFEGGWIYDPEAGKRYKLSAEMRGSKLAIIGFVGFEAMNETHEWRRAPAGLGRCSA